jgi:hypothetical protein
MSVNSMAELEYRNLLETQIKQATGMRLEQLQKQGEGEHKLMVEIVWPVRKTFEGIILEKEIVTLTGAKAYIDAFDEKFRLGLESEGFVVHAERVTRPRFDFERNRIRSMLAYGIHYTPFTYDEMDKRPEICRRALYEIYGSFSSPADHFSKEQLTLYEREVVRYALWLGQPFSIRDVQACTNKGEDFCRKVIRSLLKKRLIRPMYLNRTRNHYYVLEEKASSTIWYSARSMEQDAATAKVVHREESGDDERGEI